MKTLYAITITGLLIGGLFFVFGLVTKQPEHEGYGGILAFVCAFIIIALQSLPFNVKERITAEINSFINFN